MHNLILHLHVAVAVIILRSMCRELQRQVTRSQGLHLLIHR